MATREQTYTEQMKALGIYQEIFDPEIKMLCTLERDLQRLTKRWKNAGCPTVSYDSKGAATTDKTLDAITTLRREILAHRDALGLTPKGLNRLKPTGSLPGSRDDSDAEPTPLELIRTQARRRTGT